MLKFNHSSFLAISVSVLMLLGAGCSSDGSASDEPDCTESDRCSASDSSSSVDEELEPEEYTDSDDESDTVVEPVGEHESEDDVIEEPVSDDEPDPVTDPVDPGSEPVDPGSEPVDPGSEPVDPGSEPVDPGTEQPVIDPKPEPQPDPVYCNQEIIKTFKLKRKGAELPIGESQALSMKIVTDARTYKVSDFPCDLVWSSSDTKIATISSAGKVTAVAAGHATVTVTTKDKKLSSSIKIHVLDLDNLKRTITADMVEISGFRLEHRTAAAQGFDFGTSPYLFIAQNGSSGKAGGAQHINAIQKIDPAKQDLTGAKQNPTGIMNIKYAGHAQNINWEKSGNQEYIWVSNYGTIKAKDGDNRYIKSQTISRIPWTVNTKETAIAPDETTENYYYPKMVNIQPILNLDYNFMGFWAQNSDATKFYIKIFYLGEAKALTPVSKKLPYAVTWGGGSSPDAQKTFTPTVMVKDLSQLTPVYEITYNNRDSLYTADYQQGIIANNSGVYMLWGTPKDEDKDGIYTPRARVYYITRKGKSTRYNLNFDISALKKLDISSIGYLEPEGMRMVDGVLYILYATVGANIDGKEDTSTKRIAIIKYDLAQKYN